MIDINLALRGIQVVQLARDPVIGRKNLSQWASRRHGFFHLVDEESKGAGLCDHRTSYVRPERFFSDCVYADP